MRYWSDDVTAWKTAHSGQGTGMGQTQSHKGLKLVADSLAALPLDATEWRHSKRYKKRGKSADTLLPRMREVT